MWTLPRPPRHTQVNNIPQVGTQNDFRALIKAQNIPHSSYDIDGDGVVSQEDYALAKVSDYVCAPDCVDVNGIVCDGVFGHGKDSRVGTCPPVGGS